MAGGSGGQNDIVWPGYVAAMASLLLSLLLVCAVLVMTIGQIGTLSEGYQQAMARTGFGTGQDISRLAKLAGLDDSAASSAASDTSSRRFVSASADIPPDFIARFHSTRFGRNAQAGESTDGSSKRPLVLDLAKGHFDPDAARQAAALAAQDRQLLAQVDLSRVDIQKIRFNHLDFSGVALHKSLTPAQMARIDFKGVDFGNLTPERVQKIKPLLAKEAIRYQLALHKSAGKTVTAPPPPVPAPPVLATPPPSPPAVPLEHFSLTFVDETWDLQRTQKTQFSAWADILKTAREPVRLWAEVPAQDDLLKRSAYARLQLVRSWLLDAGLPADRLRLALQSTGAAPMRELTVHIELQKR